MHHLEIGTRAEHFGREARMLDARVGSKAYCRNLSDKIHLAAAGGEGGDEWREAPLELFRFILRRTGIGGILNAHQHFLSASRVREFQ